MEFFHIPFCFICGEDIRLSLGWKALFTNEKDPTICKKCELQLEEITGDCCRICDRPFASIEKQFRQGDRCYDCVRWEEDSRWAGVLEQNKSLFVYNEFLTEVIARFKFRGDYAICFAFAEKINNKLQQLQYDLIMPIPLSEERLYERGFNQASALLDAINEPYEQRLARVHLEKQSKKTRHERLSKEQIFTLNPSINIVKKHVLLVDDIYTTGTTLRQAAKRLKEAGAATVRSLTLARG